MYKVLNRLLDYLEPYLIRVRKLYFRPFILKLFEGDYMKFRLGFASSAVREDLEYAKEHLEKFENYRITEVDGRTFIEFNSLEELGDFMKVEGQIILDEERLTVYDDYYE